MLGLDGLGGFEDRKSPLGRKLGARDAGGNVDNRMHLRTRRADGGLVSGAAGAAVVEQKHIGFRDEPPENHCVQSALRRGGWGRSLPRQEGWLSGISRAGTSVEKQWEPLVPPPRTKLDL